MEEVDLYRSEEHDLSVDELWEKVATRVQAGQFHAIMMSPPCSTWSRAVWANRKGPQPVRSAAYPYGFPWLRGSAKTKAQLGTLLVQRCIDVLRRAPRSTTCTLEHPEDLGRSRN